MPSQCQTDKLGTLYYLYYTQFRGFASKTATAMPATGTRKTPMNSFIASTDAVPAGCGQA